jgi:hypothetical protein
LIRSRNAVAPGLCYAIDATALRLTIVLFRVPG